MRGLKKTGRRDVGALFVVVLLGKPQKKKAVGDSGNKFVISRSLDFTQTTSWKRFGGMNVYFKNNSFTRGITALISTALVVAIASCGGSGGSAPTAPTAAPTVTAQPTAMVATPGGSVTFTVTASGNAVAYQWQVSIDAGTTWSNIAGATTASYTISFVYPYMNGYLYQALISSGGNTVTSSAAALSTSSSSGVVQTFAGSGTLGAANGVGTAASFSNPVAAGVDGVGNIYVADSGNNLIRKISPSGAVTTFAGSGSAGSSDGTGTAASFNYPAGVAVDSTGNVYVADSNNNTIRKITPAGVVTTLAGSTTAGSSDGTGSAAGFHAPAKIAIDASGTLYVADSLNNMIREVSPVGVVTTLAGSTTAGSANGTGSAAGFNYPRGIAVDTSGNVYVADSSNNMIREITPAGVVTTLAGSTAAGSTNGTGVGASFASPRGVAVDSYGNVYVADSNNNLIREITPQGVVTTLTGSLASGATNGSLAAAQFFFPTDVVLDRRGDLYVVDDNNDSIRIILGLPGTLGLLAGNFTPSTGSADGTGAAAQFNNPAGVAIDSSGSVFVGDAGNNTIRKITAAGAVTTFAGTAGLGGSTDGTGSAARFSFPYGIATDGADNIYVADWANNAIRKITSVGVVTTLAGTAGVTGSADGTGAAASFNVPIDVAADSAGNVYVADRNNNTIRKVSAAGVVSTFAGSAGAAGSVDGTGAAARFNSPAGVATDSAGNVYVGDWGNNTVRKISPAGVVTTLAGTAGIQGSADGSGAAAQFAQPDGVATDSAGNVYVADHGNATVRKITATGVVTTVVGVAGLSTFSAGSLPGQLPYPYHIAIKGRTLYVTGLDGVAVVTNLP